MNDKLSFNNVNIYWAIAVFFAIWIIVLEGIILMHRGIKNKIHYSSYKYKSIKENNRKNLEQLWTIVDKFSENDRKDIMTFLETNDKQISKGGAFYYERLLASQDKEAVANEIDLPEKIEPKKIIKDPYVLEFLGLEGNTSFYEKDLGQMQMYINFLGYQ